VANDLKNCKRCGKIFMYAGVPICPECLAKEEEQYRKVKRYLDKHPRAGVKETSEETGVPTGIVIEFLRQGLLVAVSGPEGQLTCMICKRPIMSGKICPKCEEGLAIAAGKAPPQDAWDRLNKSTGYPNKERMYVMEMISKKKE